MADLFTRGIDLTTGQLRPPVEQAPHLYKETELGWVPKEWIYSKLGKFIEKNLYGPRFDANFYTDDGNVKTIRGTDFTKDGDILYDQVPVARLPISKIHHHILKQGDVIIVTTADCGLTAVFKSQEMDFIPSAYVVKYRFFDSVSPYFIKYYMQTAFSDSQVKKYVRQGTLGNLPGSDLLCFLISLPNKNEQREIVNRLGLVRTIISKENIYMKKLLKQKKGLMQDLLTGAVKI